MSFRAAVLFTALIPVTPMSLSTTLHSLKDRVRPLLIVAPPNDLRVQQQLATLRNHAAGLRDRDMIVSIVASMRQQDTNVDGLPFVTFEEQEQQHIRHRFHVRANEFAVILIGKDGGEKLRSASPVSWQRLSATVDAMPMRREEMNRK